MSPFHADRADHADHADPADRGAADPFAETDALGLGASLPRPGWVVIDAVRERAFTGEVVCTTEPVVHLFSDRGQIYVAERDGDGQLGARLVAAGALDADQLARGAVHLGDVEHLGRLFDRDPSIDRDRVLVATELLTEDCLGWLAAERVTGAVVTPYRHHASGIHRWEHADDHDGVGDVSDVSVGDSLPAGAPVLPMPAPSAAPVALPAPVASALQMPTGPASMMPPPPALAPAASGTALPPLATPAVPAPPIETAQPEVSIVFGDALDPSTDQESISWSEPGWLDRPLPGDADPYLLRPLSVGPPTVMSAPPAAVPAPAAGSLLAGVGDWIDRLGIEGLPERGSDPLARPAPLPPLGVEPVDRFEVIWPSGEVDEQFGSQVTETFPNPDIDRAGPTARMVRDGGVRVADAEVEHALGSGVADIEQWLAAETVAAPDDDVVLAVRRTAAGIDAGALSQRMPTPPAPLATAAPVAHAVPVAGMAAPVVTQPAVAATARMTVPSPSAGSVFDTVPGAPVPAPVPQADPAAGESPEVEGAERVSALRRLIGSLRRR